MNRLDERPATALKNIIGKTSEPDNAIPAPLTIQAHDVTEKISLKENLSTTRYANGLDCF